MASLYNLRRQDDGKAERALRELAQSPDCILWRHPGCMKRMQALGIDDLDVMNGLRDLVSAQASGVVNGKACYKAYCADVEDNPLVVLVACDFDAKRLELINVELGI